MEERARSREVRGGVEKRETNRDLKILISRRSKPGWEEVR